MRWKFERGELLIILKCGSLLRRFHWREFLSVHFDHSFWTCHLLWIIPTACLIYSCWIVAQIGIRWMACHPSVAQMILGVWWWGQHGLIEGGIADVCRDIEPHLCLLKLACWGGLDHADDASAVWVCAIGSEFALSQATLCFEQGSVSSAELGGYGLVFALLLVLH